MNFGKSTAGGTLGSSTFCPKASPNGGTALYIEGPFDKLTPLLGSLQSTLALRGYIGKADFRLPRGTKQVFGGTFWS